MKKRMWTLLFSIIPSLIIAVNGYAYDHVSEILSLTTHLGGGDANQIFSERRTIWKGFEKIEFDFEERKAFIVKPKKARDGNPWIWRARFPEWHTEMDSMLLSEGFHVAFLNTNDMFGSPQAMSVWNRFYDYLLEAYDLNEKVALEGVSRGGLFVYNWAKLNPEKVTCIYAEAPVCDFKSWPGGFGTGVGSESDWGKLKQAYGFKSDDDARAYRNNPIDNLEQLAKAKVPVLHMIGLKDQVVPPEENTFVFVDRYVKLGGSATIIPCTEGKQNLQGHHFPIETPRLAADFIIYHSELRDQKLNSSAYHQLRGGLKNSFIQFDKVKTGRVAFLGGSITFNGGWRDSVCRYLQKRFPETEFEFIAAGIPSMGTTPGAFRLERDVLSKGTVDLLFEEAAVNDAINGRSADEQVNAMEGIVRHMKRSNPFVDIVMMHFVDPSKMEDYRSGRIPDVIRNHNMVADHYNIPTINLAKEVTDRIDHGEFTWEGDFKDLHPSPFGQGVYANSIIDFLDHAFNSEGYHDDRRSATVLPRKLKSSCYDNGTLIDISSIKKAKGWYVDPSWAPKDNANVRPNYVNVPMLISETPGSTLKTTFTGNTVGIAVAAGQDAGMIEYRVNKNEWKKLNLFTPWSKTLHLPWYYTLAGGLTPGRHQLEIRVADDMDERSTGHACRIRYVYVNRP